MQSGVCLQSGIEQLPSGLRKKHSYSDEQPRFRHFTNKCCTSTKTIIFHRIKKDNRFTFGKIFTTNENLLLLLILLLLLNVLLLLLLLNLSLLLKVYIQGGW